jgi:hypothetical protein
MAAPPALTTAEHAADRLAIAIGATAVVTQLFGPATGMAY